MVLTTFDSLSYVSRKNPLGAVRAFGEAFSGDDKARLIVKTHNASAIADEFGRRVWGEVLRRAAADPRIVIIDETLSYADVMALKAGSNCYLSLHRSEGFRLRHARGHAARCTSGMHGLLGQSRFL